MKDLNVYSEEGLKTITVLEGAALEEKAPNMIRLKGDIKTVANFLNVRRFFGTGLQTIDRTKAVVLVDKKEMSILLQLDPENYYGATVKGVLEESDEIKPWYINMNKTFQKLELVKLLKFSRIYFDSDEKHSEMLIAFQKVDSTVNIRANDSEDDRGNKERAYIKSVTSNAPTEFILDIPVYKGYPSVRFRVDVCLDVTDGSPRFWFESVELHNKKLKQVTEIFDDQLQSAEGMVIINV